jgi:hypothetical protein
VSAGLPFQSLKWPAITHKYGLHHKPKKASRMAFRVRATEAAGLWKCRGGRLSAQLADNPAREVDAAQGLLGSNDLSARRPVLSMKVLAAMRRFVTPALA